MSQRKLAAAACVSYVSWFCVLFWLSSGPVDSLPAGDIPHIDKVYHAGYFFLGGAFLTLAISLMVSPRRSMLVFLVISCSLLVGMFDEWHQSFSPGRSGGDPLDLAADVLGGTLAVLIFTYIHHVRIIGLTKGNAAR